MRECLSKKNTRLFRKQRRRMNNMKNNRMKLKIIRSAMSGVCLLGILFCLFLAYRYFTDEFNLDELIHDGRIFRQFLIHAGLITAYCVLALLFILKVGCMRKEEETSPYKTAGAFSGLLAFFLFILIFLGTTSHSVRHLTRKTACVTHLRLLYQACLSYADQYKDNFPSDLTTLKNYVHEDGIFRCPANFRHEGISDYNYCGSVLKKNALPNQYLLLEEKKTYHPRRFGPTKLFLDRSKEEGYFVQ